MATPGHTYADDARPTAEELCDELRQLVDWQKLAIELPEIGMTDVETIERDHQRDNERQKLALYEKWLGKCLYPTWGHVINGLKKIEKNALAKGIEGRIIIAPKKDTRKLTLELKQDEAITELDKLHKDFSKILSKIVTELEKLCARETDKLQEIAVFARELILENIELVNLNSITDLIGKLYPHYDFIDCDIIRDIAEEYLEGLAITSDIVEHAENTKRFKESRLITELAEDLGRKMDQISMNNGDYFVPITIRISRKWGGKTVKGLCILINNLLPQPYPKIALFKYIKIIKGSISIQYVVLRSCREAAIAHAVEYLPFMELVGVHCLVIDGTPVLQESEDLSFSIDESLLDAAFEGNEDAVKLLLDIGASVNYQDSDGLTALMNASFSGQHWVAKLLLQNENINLNLCDHKQQTALTIACHKQHYQIVELLLANKTMVDLNIQTEDKWTALMSACHDGQYKAIALLLINNADTNIQTEDGWTALMEACDNGYNQIVELLLYNNADPRIQTNDGWTALMSACYNGHHQVAKLLLENGVDPNTRTEDGRTALMSASENGHYNVVELLLRKGADPNIQTENGRTALMVANKNEHHHVVELLQQY